MKKILLTLVLCISYFAVGAVITKAEVLNTSVSVTSKTIKLSSFEYKLSLLEKKISSVETICSPMDACDNALLYANLTLALAFTTCQSQGWESPACTSAMGQAEQAVNAAVEQCNQSNNIRKTTPVLPLKNVGKNQDGKSG